MPNSFAERIEKRLAGLGRGTPALVECEHDENNFGSAHAAFQLGRLTLRFVDDRGLEAIDVEISDGNGGNEMVPLESLAVAANLLSLDDLLYHYGLSDNIADASVDNRPPTGPFLKLDGAFELLGEQWERVIHSCRNERVLWRLSRIQVEIKERLAQSFSSGAPN